MLDRNHIPLIVMGLTLFLSACSPSSSVITVIASPTPIDTATPVSTTTPRSVSIATAPPTLIAKATPAGTPTPPNEFFLQEIVKTPQPTPWATSLPNNFGITPGITTEAEVRARFGDPKSLGCIMDGKEVWYVPEDCLASSGLRKFLPYDKRNFYVQVEGGRVVSVIFSLSGRNMPMTTVQKIVDKYGIPEVVKFSIPKKRTYPISARPSGQLVYASKGIEFLFDCQKASGELCEGVPRDGLVVDETHFAPMSITGWFEQEKTNPPFYSDRGLEFYIRPWAGFSN